jgi:transcriptional regulator with XRE-family HTH domain
MPPVKTHAFTTFVTQLTKYRESHRLSQAQLAGRLGYSPSLLSYVMSMTKMPTAAFAEKCDEVFGLQGTFAALHDLASRETLPSYFAPVAEFEGQAVRVHEYELRAVPGLLQTEDYARAVIHAGQPRQTEAELERKVTARMERQAILTGDSPPHYWTVLHESVLRQNIGGPAVMGAQLDKITEAESSPHMIIQVLPFAATVHPGTDGPVTIFDFDDGKSSAYSECKGGGRIVEAHEEIADLVTSMSLIRVAALPPDESRALLRQIRQEISG